MRFYNQLKCELEWMNPSELSRTTDTKTRNAKYEEDASNAKRNDMITAYYHGLIAAKLFNVLSYFINRANVIVHVIFQ